MYRILFKNKEDEIWISYNKSGLFETEQEASDFCEELNKKARKKEYKFEEIKGL